MNKQLWKSWRPVFEGEEEAAAKAEAAKKEAEEAAAKKEAEEAQKRGERLFTQSEVNKIMAENKRSLQAKNETLIKELETIKKASGTTPEQKAALEKRIEELQDELLTKEELSRKEQEKLKKQYDEKINITTKERDDWQTKYTNETIERSITDAAVSTNAISPRQIAAILRPKAVLVQEVDSEGQPTGKYVPKVKFDTTDKDGKPVVLDLTIPEAVKQMKDMEEYFNLFKGEGTSGLGVRSSPSGKQMDVKALAKDPQKYREARKAGKI